MKLRWTIVVALAACGPKPGTGTVSNLGAPAARGTVPPCPEGDALEAAAMAAWGKTAGRAEAGCVALWARGEPLWALEGWYFPPDDAGADTIGGWTAVVTPAGEVRFRDGDDELPYGASEHGYSAPVAAVDLDGDGDDELVVEQGYDHMGYSQSSVSVASFASGALVESVAMPLSDDNSAGVEDPADVLTCTGSYRVIDGPDGTHRIEITGAGQPHDGCAAPGVHVYAWNGSALVEMLGSR